MTMAFSTTLTQMIHSLPSAQNTSILHVLTVMVYGVNVHTARKNMGKRLAQEFQYKADIVVGVPNSSLSANDGIC